MSNSAGGDRADGGASPWRWTNASWRWRAMSGTSLVLTSPMPTARATTTTPRTDARRASHDESDRFEPFFHEHEARV